MSKTAIVAGATGLIGGELIKLLVENSTYTEVIALVRRKAAYPSSRKLIELETDWSEKHLEAALQTKWKGADVFCALGTTMKKAKSKQQFRIVDYEYPVMLARLAKRYDASQFIVVSAVGSDPNSIFFYSKVKGEMEEKLKTLQLPGLHIFRPSLLVGDRAEVRVGEKAGEFAGKGLSFLMIGKLRKYRPIAAKLVAQGMVAAARKGSKGVQLYEYDQIAWLGS